MKDLENIIVPELPELPKPKTQAAWVALALRTDIRQIAAICGKSVQALYVVGCPLCKKEIGHRKSAPNVGAVRVYGTRWYCCHCTQTGSALDFVAGEIGGRKYKGSPADVQLKVKTFFKKLAGVNMPELPTIAADAGEYPEGAQQFWESISPLSLNWDASVREYFTAQKFPEAVFGGNYFRYVKAKLEVPAWAHGYRDHGYLLVAPLYDVHGVIQSISWRRIDGESPKTLCSRGRRSGLFHATPEVAQALATGTSIPKILICEGDKDWAMAASYGQPAIGIMTGAWTSELAARLLNTEVTVATDNDDQGHRFAKQIMDELPQAKRWTPERGKDLSEHVQACTGLVL